VSYQGADDPQLLNDVRAALQRWSKPALGDTSLSVNLGSVERRQAANREEPRAEAVRGVIRAALERLRAGDQADPADLLERRYLRDQSIYRLCEHYHLSERSLYYRLKEASTALAHALWAGEKDLTGLRATPGRRPDRSVHLPPPTYTQLFGVTGLLAELLQRLDAPDDHWLVSVEGMGGLGKTALAREAAGRLAETDRFTAIAWATAKQEFYTWCGLEQADRPALTFEQLLDIVAAQLGDGEIGPLPLAAKTERVRALLQTRPYLVVVDNLETAVDCEALPAQLWTLARPSKFLLTSRHRLAPCPGLSSLAVDELGEVDSLALVRHEGYLRGLQEIAQAQDDALRPIVAATGGHPLAIKLVVGQLASLPLGRVLAVLENAQPGADLFYRYVYHPSWDLLSQPAKRLLLHMILLPASGGGWEDLAAITVLSTEDLAAAIGELTTRSFLQAGGLEEKTYTIHRLTHHFVAGREAAQAVLVAGALRAGEYYVGYARRYQRDWVALARRQDHILQAMQLCAAPSSASGQVPSSASGRGPGAAGQRIVVQCAQLLNTYMMRRGYWATWVPYLDLALLAAGDLGDEAAQADLWNRLGLLRTRQGELDVALALHRRAAGAFRRLGDDLNLARTLRWEGNVHYTRADLPAAQECYQQAHALLALLDEPRELSYTYNNIANVHFNQGEWSQALSYYERALELLDPEQDRHDVITLLNNTGLLRWQMGYWRQAEDRLVRTSAMLQETGDRVSLANTHHYLCRVYMDLEAWNQALDHGRQAHALRTAFGSAEGLADLYTDLAAVHLRMEDEGEAVRYLELAAPIWREAGRPRELARTYLLRGELHGQAGDWSQARSAYQEALSLLESEPDSPRHLAALLGLAHACWKTGDAPAARVLSGRVQALASQLPRPDLHIRVLWLQADLDPSTAHRCLERALALCQARGAGNDRLDRLCRETQARLKALDAHQDSP
jgi:tetratricopeptide (TPR) repeat protein